MKVKLALVSALSVVLLAGCGSHQTVYTGPNGEKVTVSKNGGTIEAQGPNGEKVTETVNGNNITMKNDKGESFSMGTNKVSEDDLGLPFYPGSVEQPNGSMITNTAQGKAVMCIRTTPDDPDKVKEFYADKLAGATNYTSNSAGEKALVMGGKLKDASEVSIMANKKGSDNTIVQVSVTHKKS